MPRSYFILHNVPAAGELSVMSSNTQIVEAPPAHHEPGSNDYYRTLDANGIIRAVTLLNQRICRKFPDSGLSKVAAELLTISQEAADRAAMTERPHIPLRIGTGLLLVLTLGYIGWLIAGLHLNVSVTSALDLLQGLESTINVLLLAGAGTWSLVSLETRIKRTAALRMLHELRVMAHLVDMHQLTKDPKCLFTDQAEVVSPGTPLTTPQLAQYLDYCNDMLSLTGKVAALYAQYFDDRVVLQAIDEVESLTTSLSRKIWQKIMILHEIAVNDLDAAGAEKAHAS
jgi:hypothetical protein